MKLVAEQLHFPLLLCLGNERGKAVPFSPYNTFHDQLARVVRLAYRRFGLILAINGVTPLPKLDQLFKASGIYNLIEFYLNTSRLTS
ncbi:hypothetical protein ACYZT3_28190 [Pseudomonas sp. MDT1-16]